MSKLKELTHYMKAEAILTKVEAAGAIAVLNGRVVRATTDAYYWWEDQDEETRKLYIAGGMLVLTYCLRVLESVLRAQDKRRGFTPRPRFPAPQGVSNEP